MGGGGGAAAFLALVLVVPGSVALASLPLARFRSRRSRAGRSLYLAVTALLAVVAVGSAVLIVLLARADPEAWMLGVIVLGPAATIAVVRLLREGCLLAAGGHPNLPEITGTGMT